MFTPLLNIQENYRAIAEQKKEANGYCLSCNKPTKHVYCHLCEYYLLTNGLERQRVTFGDVGRATVNYQQYLHTSFFNCNASYQYRGIKEDRIDVRIPDNMLTTAATSISNLYSKNTFIWLEKKWKVNPILRNAYQDIKLVRNIDKRLVYNILLYNISYKIDNNKQFKSDAHYYASLFHHVSTHIHGVNYKVNKIPRPILYKHINKYYYYINQELDRIIAPLLHKIIEQIY